MSGQNHNSTLPKSITGAMKQKDRKIKNVAASVRARLLDLARKEKRDYNALILQYFQERFLFRLSISSYKNNFVLKGALLFLTFDMPRTRPTKDIDFLGKNTANDPKNIRKIIAEILTIDGGDGVSFLADDVHIERIVEANEYHGLRIRFTAMMDTIKRTMQIDLGFGDSDTPGGMDTISNSFRNADADYFGL